jgi:hypothetical protein
MSCVGQNDLAFVAGFLVATGLFWVGGGFLWLLVCLRRLSRIRIRLTGVPAHGEVIGMVVRSDVKGTVLNSPQVRYFSAEGGEPVLTQAVGYRNRHVVTTGAQVRLWYDPLKPQLILVSRFDIKPRDFVALVGAALTTAVGIGLEALAYFIA